jgi:hypothetical protein
MSNPTQPRQLKLEVEPNLKATYSNMVVISHTQHEVVLDFVQVVPSDNRARVLDRVIMTPNHAKMLMQALAENLGRYEAKYGDIKVPNRPGSLADQLFSTVSNPPSDGNNE